MNEYHVTSTKPPKQLPAPQTGVPKRLLSSHQREAMPRRLPLMIGKNKGEWTEGGRTR